MRHDDAGDGVHVLLKGHITPDGAPEAHARYGNDHTAVLSLEDRELAGGIGARQVVEQREDIFTLDGIALAVENAGLDHIVILDLCDQLLGRNLLLGGIAGIERHEDRLLLLVELVLGLTLLETQGSQSQQGGHDDDHHRRVDHDIEVAVRIETLLLGLQLREFRGGSSAEGAGRGCGRSFVDVSADIAFKLFLCHISPPYFAVLTRFLRREMLDSTTK